MTSDRVMTVIGAGSVGLGFIGQLFSDDGWEVVFCDVNPDVLARLNRDRGYRHICVSNQGDQERFIAPVRAVDSADPAALARAVAHTDALATAVGARALPAVAAGVAAGIRARIEQGAPPFTILLCENLHGAPEIFRALLADRLPEVDAASLDAMVGLAATSIGRMIPVTRASPDPAEPVTVRVEPYAFLPFDATAVRGPALEVPGLVNPGATPFGFYSDRKLYVHNLGHCLAAYLGEQAGAEFVWQAIADPAVRYFVRSAMVESALVQARRYGVEVQSVVDHVDDLIARFGNRALADTVERVGRDPERKMAAGDRFVGAYTACRDAGMVPRYLSAALAVGAARLGVHHRWDRAHLDAHLTGMLGRLPALLTAQLDALAAGFDFASQVGLVDAGFDPPRIP